MFGIGLQEMIIILVVVLIVFGPKRLPDLAKSLGKGIAEFKKASDEVRKGIEEAVQEEEGKAPPTPAGEADGTVEARSLEAYAGDSTPSLEPSADAPPADAPPADARSGDSGPPAPTRPD
jgi:sec-independent protein translocase protein TatA